MKKMVVFGTMLIGLFSVLPITSQTPAFPGAEGSGMYTTGGRGGKVLYVTSLEDTEEPGTLRWAIKQKGKRTILFKVSGHIRLVSPLKINNGDVTIAGQSAQGDGICISDHETVISADNVIVRFLRFRLGDRAKEGVDAFSGKDHKNIIIDHCSMSWSVDEISSFYDNENFTMQWCFITESLRNSSHKKGGHGYGGIWGGHKATFHHNLFAHNDSRNPRFCGSRYTNRPDLEKVDYRNNVIYNWGNNNAYAAEGGSYNIINNYYKYGPASSSGSRRRILNPDADNGENKQPKGTHGRFFVKGNYLDGNPNITHDNKLGVVMGATFEKFAPKITLGDIIAEREFDFLPVATDEAAKAYQKVLNYGGCSLVRDSHDKRYVKNVKERSYTFEGSNGSTNGLIDSQNDVGSWPEYKTYNTYNDSDADGIPDGWLEENHPGKKATDIDADGYTYLEVYLNSLVSHLMGQNCCSFTQVKNTFFSDRQVKHVVVDKAGNGDFVTVQEAVNSVRAFDPAGTTVIFIRKGVYYEKIVIPDHVTNVKIVGEDRDKTIITYNDHANINNMGTFRTYTMQVRGNDIWIENLTIENNAEQLGQAVALHTEGDRIVLDKCRLLGNQDTVYTGGGGNRLLFHNCYIEGTTDFIFGSATAWFEKCTIHGKKNSYITAASTPQNIRFGYIFDKCKITLGNDVTSLYLGRPWRAHAMTVFMNCELPKGIHPERWENWRNPENEKTARYGEYKNFGEGVATHHRVKWARILTDEEAAELTINNVLKDQGSRASFCK